MKGSLSPHAGPVLGLIISAFMLVVSLSLSTPKIDDLVEVSGHVRSARLAEGRTLRRGVIFTLDDRTDLYWTNALTAHPADGTVKGMVGSFVRTYVEKAPSLPNSYGGARQTWGLSIDGAAVQSPGEALDTDRARKHVLLPLIALTLAAISSIGVLYNRGRSEPRAAQTLRSHLMTGAEFAAQTSVRFSTTSMFKQFLPGLCVLIGLCLLSAVLQTLHILEPERVMAGAPLPKVSSCDCDTFRPATHPSR